MDRISNEPAQRFSLPHFSINLVGLGPSLISLFICNRPHFIKSLFEVTRDEALQLRTFFETVESVEGEFSKSRESWWLRVSVGT